MHRCLILHISGALDDEIREVGQDFTQRSQLGQTPTQSEFIHIPAAGVGNLTKPVEVLRQNLWDETRLALTKLLQATPGQVDPFTLDVLILCSFGAPMHLEAVRVALDCLEENLEPYLSVFPSHERAASRRLRVFMAGYLTSAHRSTERRDALRDLVKELRGRKLHHREERMVDRLILLDSITPRGVVSDEELRGHLEAFSALLVLGDIRTSDQITRALTEPGHDVIATLGCVRAILRITTIQDEYTELLLAQVANAARKEVKADLPNRRVVFGSRPPQMDEVDGIRERILNRTLETLDALGPLSLPSLSRWLDDLAALNPDDFRQLEEDDTPPEPKLPLKPVLAVSGVFSIGAYAVATLLLGMSAVVSAGTSLAAFAVVLALLGLAHHVANRQPKKVEEKPAEDVLARIREHVLELHSKVETLRSQLEIASTTPISLESRRQFLKDEAWRVSLGGADISATLIETQHPHGGPEDSLVAFFREIGTWKELLEEPETLSPGALLRFCESVSSDVTLETILRSKPCLALLLGRAESWIATWKHGVPVHMDMKSQIIHDEDGVRQSVDNLLVAPKALDINLDHARRHLSESIQDIWLLSVVHDIHEDAIPTLSKDS